MDRRSRKGLKKDTTMALQLKNGQLLTTLPRELVRWKHISKGTMLRWSDGGPDRLIVEIA